METHAVNGARVERNCLLDSLALETEPILLTTAPCPISGGYSMRSCSLGSWLGGPPEKKNDCMKVIGKFSTNKLKIMY